MADIKGKIEADVENLDRILRMLPGGDALAGLSQLELAGVAALLQSFYNGVENVLKQLAASRGLTAPAGDSWHRDLIELTGRAGILSDATRGRLGGYLAFRHFFSHAYAFDLDPERMRPLVDGAAQVYSSFRTDIARALEPGTS